MRRLERALARRGYAVLNFGYPSRTGCIDCLAEDVARGIAAWHPERRLDFVAHSLGGILVRVAAAHGWLPADRIGRVVMLGTPNGGSELADILPALPALRPVYTALTGPAGLELGTQSSAVPARLPTVEFELGVIAGNRSINPIFSTLLGGPNDGMVRVDCTRAPGMRDFLVVPHSHPMLLLRRRVAEQTIHFLEHGGFRRWTA
jgi:pimeloyl-ACP methyl ester carboxylesterase